MFPRTHLLGLPRGIRDLVYDNYLSLEGGYVFNFQSGKLGDCHNIPIDVSLLSSCRQIALETHGVAFEFNTITFATGHSRTASTTAGLFNYFVKTVHARKATILSAMRPCLTSEIIARIAYEYPQFQEIIRTLPVILDIYDWDLGLPWGETPSVYRDFVDAVLIPTSQQPNFLQALDQMLTEAPIAKDEALKNPHGILSLKYTPWTIPRLDDIARMASVIESRPVGHEFWERQIYRISAAALAINFLDTLIPHTRRQVRKIRLLEDRPAVAFPECHVRGLIPFCRDDANLRIERSVDLWRNAFQDVQYLHIAIGRGPQFAARFQYDSLHTDRVSGLVAP
jgi:hypothetical protein